MPDQPAIKLYKAPPTAVRWHRQAKPSPTPAPSGAPTRPPAGGDTRGPAHGG